MEPSHLNKAMLAFELLRREATPTGDVAKDTLMLRMAMLKDTPVQATMVDVTTETKACDELLLSLETKFAACTFEKRTPTIRRIESQIAHLLNRYNNLLEMDGADANALHSKILTVVNMIETLEGKLKLISSLKLPEEEISNVSDSDFPETDTEVKKPGRVETLIKGYGGGKPGGRSPNSRTNILKPEPKVWKWRVRFDGSRDFNAEQFVERVEELAGADGVPLEKLLQQMVKLLEGKALRSESGNFETWADFKMAFRETFLPPGYDDQLFDLIRSRRQAEDETFEMYLAAMNTLFRRLDRKLSHQDRLRIVSRNMSKFLRRSLLMQEYRSVDELRTLAKRAERREHELHDVGEKYRERLVEPELLNQSSRKKVAMVSENSPEKHQESLEGAAGCAEVPPGSSANPAKDKLISFQERRVMPRQANEGYSRPVRVCWTCNKPGHMKQDCPLKRLSAAGNDNQGR
ncbi:hypothetical protein GE061_009592 [Apolygus lucorum]|uniref:CCHC-type domain-containing protein n=1 Tax=Apolygus lucorum TaxID=248454 RepID=A0A8S9Y2P0_APOLU|nr:hypothetical protein GE061_009592 [Apolygus lucorum]